MKPDESLVSVVAHALLNEITVISGLLAQAREHLDPNTPDNQRAADLLEASERKAHSVVENLRRYVGGTGDEQRPDRVIDLDRRASDETKHGPR